MNIVHVLRGRCNPDTANGVEKTIYNLAVHQERLGHRVYIYGTTKKAAIDLPNIITENFAPHAIPFLPSKHLVHSLVKLEANIVHFHSVYVPEHALIANKLKQLGIDYVVTPNGGCAPELFKKKGLLRRIYRSCVELPFLSKAKFVHSVGDTLAIKEYGVRSPIVVAPNGIDPSGLPTGSGQDPILEIKPEWHGRTIFTFIGRITILQKGLDLMVEAFALSLREGAKASLVLVGPESGDDRRNLEDMITRLGIGEFVTFIGPVYGDRKYDYLKYSDFFVHTSRWEGLSFSIVEALSMGVPCLVTAAANPCGFIGPYDAGLEVASDIDDVARGFLHLSKLPPERIRQMSEQARLLVETECNWEKIASTLTTAYSD
jgi:glycosyltransferase involved in cell wall biosynthesis